MNGILELDAACQNALSVEALKLIGHEAHELEVVIYGLDCNIALECNECDEVLIDFDADEEDGFNQLKEHYGHDLEVIVYTDRVTVECLTCNKVVVCGKQTAAVSGPEKSKKLIIPVHTYDEWFDGKPDYVVVELCQDRIRRIKEMAGTVRNLGVYKVVEFDYSCEHKVAAHDAEPDNGRVALSDFDGRMECETLNVTENSFFWSGYHKHTNIHWETESVIISELDTLEEIDQRDVLEDSERGAA